VTTSYYHGDHLGSARMMTSGYGYGSWQATYLPFGMEVNPQSTRNNYKFTGMGHEPETGLDNPQSLNRYSYVVNSPGFLGGVVRKEHGPVNPIDQVPLTGAGPPFPPGAGPPFPPRLLSRLPHPCRSRGWSDRVGIFVTGEDRFRG